MNGGLSISANLGRWRRPRLLSFGIVNSVPLRDVKFRRKRFPFVIRIENSVRKCSVLFRNRRVRHLHQQMVDAVEPCAFLIITLDDEPRSLWNVRAGEHIFLRLGVILPPDPRLQIHRAQFPLLQWIVDTHEKAHLLLLIRDRKPVFEKNDSRPNEHALEVGHVAKELFNLLERCKAHHPLYAGAIVPGPVEQHDFAARRQDARRGLCYASTRGEIGGVIKPRIHLSQAAILSRKSGPPQTYALTPDPTTPTRK